MAFNTSLAQTGLKNANFSDALRLLQFGMLDSYVPHPAQEKFHRAADLKERVFLAGNQSGKTFACLVEDLWWLTNTHPCFEPIHLRDRTRGFWLNVREGWAKEYKKLLLKAERHTQLADSYATESLSAKDQTKLILEQKSISERKAAEGCLTRSKTYLTPPEPSDWPYVEPFKVPMVGRVTCANEDIIYNVMVPALRRLIPPRYLACKRCNTGNPSHSHVGSWDAAWSAKHSSIKFAESIWSRSLEFKTYKQYALDPLSHDSAVLHMFHWDEEPQQKCYVINKARLSTTNGPTIGSLTPANASQWIVTDLVEKEMERDDLQVFGMEIHDNPYGNEEAIKRFLDSIEDPAERMSREKGVPGYLRYKVFKSYGDDHYIEVPDNFYKMSKDWPKTVSIDPHDSEPTAVLWTAWDIDQDEPIPYAYRELEIKGDVQTVCQAIRSFNEGDKIDLRLIDRSSMRASQLMNTDPDIDIIFEWFVRFFPDIQPVGGAGSYDPRIERMHQLFKVNPNTGVPGAFVLNTCPVLNWQLRHYNYKANLPSGESRKYQMINKKNDHQVDNFGYTIIRGPSKQMPLIDEPVYAAPPIFGVGRVM